MSIHADANASFMDTEVTFEEVDGLKSFDTKVTWFTRCMGHPRCRAFESGDVKRKRRKIGVH